MSEGRERESTLTECEHGVICTLGADLETADRLRRMPDRLHLAGLRSEQHILDRLVVALRLIDRLALQLSLRDLRPSRGFDLVFARLNRCDSSFLDRLDLCLVLVGDVARAEESAAGGVDVVL